MMVKLIYVFRRKPELTLEECQRYWLEDHSRLVSKHAATLGITRYVQVHTMDDPLNQVMGESRGDIEPYHGIAQLWWSDIADLEKAFATAEGQRAAGEILEDERRFVDHASSSIWLAREHVLIESSPPQIAADPDSPVIKMSFVFRRPHSLSLAECQSYWRDVHGLRVLDQSANFPLRRYVQSHTIEHPLNETLRAARGAMEPYDGVAETWAVLDELAGAAATPAGQRAAEEYLEDERKFIDSTRSSIWIAKEHVIIG